MARVADTTTGAVAGARLCGDDGGPAARSPHSDGAFRYAGAVRLDDGRPRFSVEVACPDGAHELVTCVVG